LGARYPGASNGGCVLSPFRTRHVLLWHSCIQYTQPFTCVPCLRFLFLAVPISVVWCDQRQSTRPASDHDARTERNRPPPRTLRVSVTASAASEGPGGGACRCWITHATLGSCGDTRNSEIKLNESNRRQRPTQAAHAGPYADIGAVRIPSRVRSVGDRILHSGLQHRLNHERTQLISLIVQYRGEQKTRERREGIRPNAPKAIMLRIERDQNKSAVRSRVADPPGRPGPDGRTGRPAERHGS
jgi:hypothetical protein